MLLDRDRDAVEGAQVLPVEHCLFGAPGLFTRTGHIESLETPEHRVELLGATEEVIGDLDR